MVTRGPLIVFAAVVFLAGGLFALRFPVFIEAYDQFGWQVKCGSGFTTDLTQASNAEKSRPAKGKRRCAARGGQQLRAPVQ